MSRNLLLALLVSVFIRVYLEKIVFSGNQASSLLEANLTWKGWAGEGEPSFGSFWLLLQLTVLYFIYQIM